ncbi:MAG TPA: hypothetical protein VF765_07595 [Polyangiaceae bacterium]
MRARRGLDAGPPKGSLTVLFAKVDVCLAVHPKFCAAGPAAVGYWVAALAYSCGQELDGRVPKQAVGAILAVGPKRGRAFCERLVSAGLFERTDDGYAIAKFAQKNVTKAQLDARRREAADRMAGHRVRANGERTEDHRDGGGDATQGASLPASRGGGVLNSLSLDLKSRDLDSEDARANVPAASSEQVPIPPDLELTQEARAGAEMLGVRDVDGEWVKFVAHHRSKGTRSADFYALWKKWSVMARNYERRDRERERDARRGPLGPAADPPPAPYHATSPQRLEVDLTAQLNARLANSKSSGEGGGD